MTRPSHRLAIVALAALVFLIALLYYNKALVGRQVPAAMRFIPADALAYAVSSDLENLWTNGSPLCRTSRQAGAGHQEGAPRGVYAPLSSAAEQRRP